MDSTISSALPMLMRSIRHPDSGLAALLGLIAGRSGSRGVGVLATHPEESPKIIAVGGRDAARIGPLGPVSWADGRFNSSGAISANALEGPWMEGDRIEWRSVHGNDAVLTLFSYGDSPDGSVLDDLAGPVYLLAELMLARRRSDSLCDQLKLERQDRALLAASLQHDLRTPLSGILGFARVLRQQDDMGSDEALDILDTIVSEAEHMAEIVADGLRREEFGPDAPLRLQPVRPTEIVENAAEAARQARSGNIILGVSHDSFISDPARLTRALLNLIDNAMKYSPDDKPVRVGGGLDGDHYRFVVADSGPGVPEDMVPTLFQPYSTDPSRPDGTGLGLHSVATIARELGGQVSYARREGWTTFSMWVSTHSNGKSHHVEPADVAEARR